MAIDNCPHSFSDLAQRELPRLMDELYIQIGKPIHMSKFIAKGMGVKKLLKNHDLSVDFQGCYVLIENGTPIYTGISKQVYRRIKLHCQGKTHFDANLAYAMAAKQMTNKMSRNARMNENEFRNLFEVAKSRIQRCYFASIPIDNALTLYLFEIYCSMELDTCDWNTFSTH